MDCYLFSGVALVALSVASASFAATPATTRLDARVEFDIPAQSLDAALLQFSRQAGVQVVSQSALVSNRPAPAVRGAASARQALSRLLAGSNLAFVVVGADTVSITESAPVRAETATRQVRPRPDRTTIAAPGPPSGPRQPPEALTIRDLVVTGSLIRGVAPVGTNMSRISASDIARSSAQSTNQILSQVPELTNAFNVIPVTPSGVGRSTFRADLRSLTNIGHANTLVLIDGHNAVGSGILQTSPDIGMLPPGAIEQVEIVADGGSSLYGSDAVGGTINFITRTRFDGLETRASAGLADHYRSYSLGVTGGFDLPKGTVMLSVHTRRNSALLNIHRDRPRQNLLPFGGGDFRVRTCAPGSITVGPATYALPTRSPGANLCDATSLGNLAPEEAQHAVFGALTWRLADNLEFELKAFGSERRTRNNVAQRSTGAGQITNANPFFSPVGTETTQSVAYSYAPVAGLRSQNRSSLSAWHLTPQLTWSLGTGWRTRLLLDLGWSETTALVPSINTLAEAAALRGPGLTPSSALNPYDLLGTNPQVLAGILDWAEQSGARQTIGTVRAVGDGPLVSWVGGQVRAAVGLQHQYTDIDAYQRFGPFAGGGVGTALFSSRKVDAIFGELLVPMVGEGRGRPGLRSFEVDLSARHDRYSDFGSTTNPRIGANWILVEGLKVRGGYGTAFTAPSLADTTAAVNRLVQVFPTSTVRPGDDPDNRLRPEIRLTGGTPNLDPMPATTWSVGVDLAPRQAEGLRLSLTYWDIDMRKRVGLAPVPPSIELYTVPGYAPYYTLNPTLAQALALARESGGLLIGATSIDSVYGAGSDPYVLTDLRRKNLGRLKVSGVDYTVAYRRFTDWGALYGLVSGVYKLSQTEQAAPGAPYVDRLKNSTIRLTARAMLGIDFRGFTASATINYTKGFPILGVAGQARVRGFATTNLFFRYDLADALELTLNVDNLFGKDPPFANVTGGIPSYQGFLLATTLGRYAAVGVSKRF